MRQGYVFTGICDSVHRGVCVADHPQADPPGRPPLGRHPMGRHPLGRHAPGQTYQADTPWADTLPDGHCSQCILVQTCDALSLFKIKTDHAPNDFSNTAKQDSLLILLTLPLPPKKHSRCRQTYSSKQWRQWLAELVPLLAIISKYGFPIRNELCCIKHRWGFNEHNSIVNSVLVDSRMSDHCYFIAKKFTLFMDWTHFTFSLHFLSIIQSDRMDFASVWTYL